MKTSVLMATLGSWAWVYAGCSGQSVELTASGAVQKGPYIEGSSIQWQRLDEQFRPTGQVYNTETLDDLGHFELTSFGTGFIDVLADGFYFDEVAGELSTSPLTLRALEEMSPEHVVNVNVLTTLARRRTRYLLEAEELPFREAQVQAEDEVVRAMGFSDILEDEPKRFSQMDMGALDESSALLIAASVVLQGQRSVAQVAELLAKIGSDLEEDGTLDDDALRTAIERSRTSVDVRRIRAHLESRYTHVAPFEVFFTHQSLVLHYTMDDDDAPVAHDASGQGHDGRYQGTEPVPGYLGGARRFNGWGDQIVVDAVGALDLGRNNQDFSLAFWIRLEQDHTGIWRTFFAHFDGQSEVFQIRMHPRDNRMLVALAQADGTRVVGRTFAPLQVERWTHVAIVRQGMALRAYFGAEPVMNVALSRGTLSAPGTLHIGSRLPPHGTASSIDDFRIYGHALSEEEISVLASVTGSP